MNGQTNNYPQKTSTKTKISNITSIVKTADNRWILRRENFDAVSMCWTGDIVIRISNFSGSIIFPFGLISSRKV